MINNALQSNDLEILNFGPSEKSLQVKEVVEIATKFWGSESKVVFNKKSNELEAETLDLDSTLARKKLGWVPIWSQKNAIIDTVTWWKDVISKTSTAEQRCKVEIQKLLKHV